MERSFPARAAAVAAVPPALVGIVSVYEALTCEELGCIVALLLPVLGGPAGVIVTPAVQLALPALHPLPAVVLPNLMNVGLWALVGRLFARRVPGWREWSIRYAVALGAWVSAVGVVLLVAG